jgi:hypothetical protein
VMSKQKVSDEFGKGKKGKGTKKKKAAKKR